MRVVYQNTLRLTLPFGWRTEEGEDCLLCYHPNGEGAQMVSLHTAETGGEDLMEYLVLLAKRYIKQNDVCLTRSLILDESNANRVSVSAEGEQSDGWNTAFQFVSNGRQVAMFTYLFQTRTRELKKAARIAESAVFID